MSKLNKNYDFNNIIVGYVRVSSSEQKNTGYSTGEQVDSLLNYAKQHELDLRTENIIIDDGYSGGSLKRPGLQMLLKELTKNTIKTVIIKNSSRLTRDPINKFSLKQAFDRYGVEIICLEGRWKAKNESEEIGDDIQVYIDAHQRKQVSPDTKRGMKASAKLGNYPFGGLPPRGYTRVKNEKLGKGCYLVPNDDYVKYIKFIFESLRDRKYTMLGIAKLYNKNEVMSCKWTERHIEIIINNPIYYGYLYTDGYDIKNHTIPIITEELFKQTQESIKFGKREPKHFYIYGGLVYCSNCNTYCREESAYNYKKKLYKYHMCPKCKKRISDDKIDIRVATVINKHTMPNEKQKLLSELYSKKNRMFKRLNIYEKLFDDVLIEEKIFYNKCYNIKKELISINTEISTIENIQIESYKALSFYEKRDIALSKIQRIDIDFKDNKNCNIKENNSKNPVKQKKMDDVRM